MTPDPNAAPVFSLAPGSWYRGFIQGKTRITIAWIFAIALVFSARHYPNAIGIVICFLGATLRFWSSGYLRKDSKLAVGGPYRFTRNPLYLGTWLMAAGAAVAISSYILLVVVSVVFIAIYHFTILDEETKLERNFGEPYRAYLGLVPRFFPRLWPQSLSRLSVVNSDPGNIGFSWKVAFANRALEPYWSFMALIAFIYVIAYGWQRFGGR